MTWDGNNHWEHQQKLGLTSKWWANKKYDKQKEKPLLADSYSSKKMRNDIISIPTKKPQTSPSWFTKSSNRDGNKTTFVSFNHKNWPSPTGYPRGFIISTVKRKNQLGKKLHLFFQFLDGLFCLAFAIFCFPAKTWLSQWSQVKRKFSVFAVWGSFIPHTSMRWRYVNFSFSTLYLHNCCKFWHQKTQQLDLKVEGLLKTN